MGGATPEALIKVLTGFVKFTTFVLVKIKRVEVKVHVPADPSGSRHQRQNSSNRFEIQDGRQRKVTFLSLT